MPHPHPRSDNKTPQIPEELSTWIDWSPFAIMGNTMPPRDPLRLCFQGRLIESAMCTNRVYQSGGKKPMAINGLLILLGFLCHWRRGRDSNPR